MTDCFPREINRFCIIIHCLHPATNYPQKKTRFSQDADLLNNEEFFLTDSEDDQAKKYLKKTAQHQQEGIKQSDTNVISKLSSYTATDGSSHKILSRDCFGTSGVWSYHINPQLNQAIICRRKFINTKQCNLLLYCWGSL